MYESDRECERHRRRLSSKVMEGMAVEMQQILDCMLWLRQSKTSDEEKSLHHSRLTGMAPRQHSLCECDWLTSCAVTGGGGSECGCLHVYE